MSNGRGGLRRDEVEYTLAPSVREGVVSAAAVIAAAVAPEYAHDAFYAAIDGGYFAAREKLYDKGSRGCAVRWVVVARGDTCAMWAAWYTGDAGRWRELDASRWRIGQVVWLPKNWPLKRPPPFMASRLLKDRVL